MAQYPIDPVVQRRLDALELLIDNEYDGRAKEFEARTGIRMAQVNQWFTGYRALRDKALRRLEEKTRKPAGYFDAVELVAQSTLQPPPTLAMAVHVLAEALRDLSPVGRKLAESALSIIAMDPSQADMAVEALQTAMRSHAPAPSAPSPAPSGGKARKEKVAPKRRADGKTALVLKIGGGNKQQLSLPLRTVADPFDPRTASPNESTWYTTLKPPQASTS